MFLKDETFVFDYGYILSLNLTVLGIIFIYSIHIPIVVVLGIVYYLMRYLTDSHLLLNMFKKEIESSGELMHKVTVKVIFLLLFYQFCIFLKIFYEDYILGSLVLFIMLFTGIVYFLNLREIMRTNLFLDEIYVLNEKNLK